jgi:hypothetical protein
MVRHSPCPIPAEIHAELERVVLTTTGRSRRASASSTTGDKEEDQ